MSKVDQSFVSVMEGFVSMPGWMNVKVDVSLKVASDYPDLVSMEVSFKDVFRHRVTLNKPQLALGLSTPVHSSDASVECEGTRMLRIQARTWHWDTPVLVSKDSVIEFLEEVDNFLNDIASGDQ